MYKFLRSAALVGAALLTTATAQAAVVNTLADFSDGLNNGQVAGIPGVTVSPVGFIDSWLVTTPADIPAQGTSGPNSIELWLENTLPAGLGNISLVSQVDSIGGGLNATFNISGAGANVFAVHMGRAEMVFVYNVLVNVFEITVPGGRDGYGGLSNFRAYNSPGKLDNPPDVPIPGAVLLLLSGIGGLGALGRYRNKSAK